MPAETLTKNEQKASPPLPSTTAPDDELRKWARQHVERVQRLKLHLAAFVLDDSSRKDRSPQRDPNLEHCAFGRAWLCWL